jgi:hypothetical protein
MTFAGFLTAVSRKMEVGVTHLSAIGYVASYKPKNPKPVPKLLETSEDYKSLMADITEYRKDCLKKKGGKVKPFSISLTDTSNTPTDGRKVRAEVVIRTEVFIYHTAQSTSKKKATQPAAPLEASEQREHELMAAIEKYHACQEHMGKACYVLTSGEHYQYTNNDLVIWATLIVSSIFVFYSIH